MASAEGVRNLIHKFDFPNDMQTSSLQTEDECPERIRNEDLQNDFEPLIHNPFQRTFVSVCTIHLSVSEKQEQPRNRLIVIRLNASERNVRKADILFVEQSYIRREVPPKVRFEQKKDLELDQLQDELKEVTRLPLHTGSTMQEAEEKFTLQFNGKKTELQRNKKNEEEEEEEHSTKMIIKETIKSDNSFEGVICVPSNSDKGTQPKPDRVDDLDKPRRYGALDEIDSERINDRNGKTESADESHVTKTRNRDWDVMFNKTLENRVLERCLDEKTILTDVKTEDKRVTDVIETELLESLNGSKSDNTLNAKLGTNGQRYDSCDVVFDEIRQKNVCLETTMTGTGEEIDGRNASSSKLDPTETSKEAIQDVSDSREKTEISAIDENPETCGNETTPHEINGISEQTRKRRKMNQDYKEILDKANDEQKSREEKQKTIRDDISASASDRKDSISTGKAIWGIAKINDDLFLLRDSGQWSEVCMLKEDTKKDKKEELNEDKKEDKKEELKEDKKKDKKEELKKDKKKDKKEELKEDKKKDKKEELKEDQKKDKKEELKEDQKKDKKGELKEDQKDELKHVSFKFLFNLSGRPLDMTFDSRHRNLYISRCVEPDNDVNHVMISVHEVDESGRPSETPKHSWKVNIDTCRYVTLSITAESNILLTSMEKKMLVEYTYNNEVEIVHRKIEITSINNPLHAVKLSKNTYVVCHGENRDEKHRVCIVNELGDILKVLCLKSNSVMNMSVVPMYLALGKGGSIIVAENRNSQVAQLKIDLTNENDLTYENVLLKSVYGFRGPCRLHLDEISGQIIVADNGHGWRDGKLFIRQI